MNKRRNPPRSSKERRAIIEEAESKNIYFRYSWNTRRIADHVERDMRFDKYVPVKCALTGIEFEVKAQDVRKDARHPRIAKRLRSLSNAKRTRAKDRIDDNQCSTLEEALAIIDSVSRTQNYREISRFHFYGTSVTRFHVQNGVMVEEQLEIVEPDGKRAYFDINQPGLYKAKHRFRNGYEIEYFYCLDRGVQNNTNFEIGRRYFNQLLDEMIRSVSAERVA